MTSADWLVGGGEIGALIRAVDWASTPLGVRDEWPLSLRTALNLVVESRVSMALLWGPELFLFHNHAFREIAAAMHPSALGRRAPEIWPAAEPVDEPAAEPFWAAVLERGEALYVEDWRLPIARGGAIESGWFAVSCSAVRSEVGTVGGVLVVLQETTLARQSRLHLRESEERLRGVLDASRDVISRLDVATGHVDYISPSCKDVLGFTPEEMMAMDSPAMGALVHPDDLPAIEDAFARAGGAIQETIEYRQRARDGQYRWLSSSLSIIKDGAGRPLYSISNLRDVTESKRIEAELRTSEERLQLAARTAGFGVHDNDLIAGRCFASPELHAITGIPVTTELAGDTLLTLAHPEDKERLGQGLRAALDPLGTGEFADEFRILRADTGEVRWVYNRTLTVFADVGGKKTAVRSVGALTDVTDRRRAEEALRESDRHKSDFLAILSHELRTPLAGVSNGLEILRRVEPGSDKAVHARAVIERQVGALTRLVDDLLDITRISRGTFDLQMSPVELTAIVGRAVEDHRGTFEKAGVALDLKLTTEPLRILGDATRLAQVVGNLLHNAAKFTPRGGRVELSLELSVDAGGAPMATLRVRDTGIGIAPETMAVIFDPYVQAQQGLDRSSGGLGLGLSIVKRLVEMHGGAARVHSDGIGRGAEFIVELPILGYVPSSAPVRSRDATRATPLRILVIEDNDDAANTLAALLQDDGHEVLIAGDGPSGIERARACKPDVVLCDVGLPGMDGYEVAEAFRADPILKAIHVIALSGYTLARDVARAAAAGFSAHLSKPTDMEKLAHLLAAIGNGQR